MSIEIHIRCDQNMWCDQHAHVVDHMPFDGTVPAHVAKRRKQANITNKT